MKKKKIKIEEVEIPKVKLPKRNEENIRRIRETAFLDGLRFMLCFEPMINKKMDIEGTENEMKKLALYYSYTCMFNTERLRKSIETEILPFISETTVGESILKLHAKEIADGH